MLLFPKRGELYVFVPSYQADAILYTLLDFAVSALEEYQQEVSDLNKKNLRLASVRQGALTRLEKCANLQQDIQKDLFGEFTPVLNEKKAKICWPRDGSA